MKKDSKIFVAGHKGMVGSAILRKLQEEGYHKLVLKSREELDLTRQKDVAGFFQSEKPEFVFLAAAKVGGIFANNKYRADFIYENLVIQNNIIHNSWKAGVKKLLFLGSTCIYPKNAPQPMSEDALLTSGLEYTNEPYAIAKIAGIKMCESYNLQYGTNFISVMPTNLYGPEDNFNLETSHVLPALLRKILLARALERNEMDLVRRDILKRPFGHLNADSHETAIIRKLADYGVRKSASGDWEVEIWGSGRPMREFLWSDDLADACLFCMSKVDFKDVIEKNATEIRNTHLNIGTGKDISIEELAKIIKVRVGFSGNLFFNTSKPDGTFRKVTDPSKINKLGWESKIDINTGIDLISKWYLNSIDNIS